jgi:hypothetical protein
MEVRAFDASGNVGTSPAVTVHLANPANIELLDLTVTEQGMASILDVSLDLWTGGIDRVRIEVDGRPLDSLTWVPFRQGLSMRIIPPMYGLQLAVGQHTMTMIGMRSNLTGTSEVEQGRASGMFTIAGTTEPAIAIQSPQPGSPVKKQVALGIVCIAGGTPSKVTYWIDSKKVATTTAAPFVWMWDSRKTKDGNHLLRAVATYSNGQSAEVSGSFVLRNTVDRQAPTVTVSQPRNNAKLVAGQSLVIAGKVKDNVGISRVEIYLDGQQVWVQTLAQFVWTTDAASLAVGKHKVQVRAIDTSGNARWSPTLMVKRV